MDALYLHTEHRSPTEEPSQAEDETPEESQNANKKKENLKNPTEVKAFIATGDLHVPHPIYSDRPANEKFFGIKLDHGIWLLYTCKPLCNPP